MLRPGRRPAGPGALDRRDRALLHSASRRIALQSAAVLAVVVAVAVVGLAVTFDRAQHGEIDRTVRSAARTADDVGDPPPGVLLVEADGGRVSMTPGAPAALAGVARGPLGRGSTSADGRLYETYVAVHDGRRFAAAYDLTAHHREETRLLWTSVAAGLLGILLAAAAGWLIGRRAVQPLARALTLQRRFVTDASHELRTPLTVLHTRAQLIRRRISGSVAPEQVRELDQLIEDTATLGDVVGDLLLSAQLHGDPVAGEEVEVGALATAVTASLRSYAQEHGTALEVGPLPAPEDATVLGAPAALRRALSALVDNAISHAPGGHVAVSVTLEGEWLRLAVRDDGEGLDPADAERLVGRFARGQGSRGHRRFGLGLSLVDEVVRTHGGQLTVDGTPGEGAEMTMILPRVVR
jgi:signal transduction histidine kinase